MTMCGPLAMYLRHICCTIVSGNTATPPIVRTPSAMHSDIVLKALIMGFVSKFADNTAPPAALNVECTVSAGSDVITSRSVWYDDASAAENTGSDVTDVCSNPVALLWKCRVISSVLSLDKSTALHCSRSLMYDTDIVGQHKLRCNKLPVSALQH